MEPPNHDQPNQPPAGGKNTLAEIIRLLRPKQWVKNVFVLAPLFFSGVFQQGTAWVPVAAVLAAFACFCCWSSAVYVLNDLCDAGQDRLHPRKCRRPIASGAVSPATALAMFVVLAVLPFLCITAWQFCAGEAFSLASGKTLLMAVGGLYLLNNLLYSFLLRAQVLLDVFSISFGFVLRLLGGCFMLGVEPSRWLVVCGFTLALFLGFGKRRMELARLDEGEAYRDSLTVYSRELLDVLLGVSLTLCVMAYMLYTVWPDTVALHGTANLIYTLPFVLYGTLRYLMAALAGQADGPVDALLHDRLFLINAVLWLAAVGCVLYVCPAGYCLR